MTKTCRRNTSGVVFALLGVFLALTLTLVACGGGQQSPPVATRAPVSQVAPASPAAAPATAPSAPASDSSAVGSGSATTPAVPAAAGVSATAPPTPVPAATSSAPEPTQAAPVMEEFETLTVYSGRSQTLVHPLLLAFGDYVGVDIEVRYGGSSSTAATILEEGDNTPADVVFLQDPGSLGTLAGEGMLAQLSPDTLDKVDPRFRDPNGKWIGTSGRARTVIYNTDFINPDTDLPDSILDFTAEEWEGRVGWAPWNGSFQAFVTALRLTEGDEAARAWLEGMRDNDAREYPNNVSIVQAAANGEVEVGFVNHYYLERFLAEYGPGFKARNYYIGNGDPGALVLVAGAGILEASDNQHTAREFIDFLLSEPAQQYFTSEIKEYPVAAGVEPEGDLPPIESLNPPNVDLGNLTDLEGTLDMLRDVGVVP